jgi:hypothetical protein
MVRWWITIPCLQMISNSMVSFPQELSRSMTMLGYLYTNQNLYFSWVISYPLSFIFFSYSCISIELDIPTPILYHPPSSSHAKIKEGCWNYVNLHMWSFMAKNPLYCILYIFDQVNLVTLLGCVPLFCGAIKPFWREISLKLCINTQFKLSFVSSHNIYS